MCARLFLKPERHQNRQLSLIVDERAPVGSAQQVASDTQSIRFKTAESSKYSAVPDKVYVCVWPEAGMLKCLFRSPSNIAHRAD